MYYQNRFRSSCTHTTVCNEIAFEASDFQRIECSPGEDMILNSQLADLVASGDYQDPRGDDQASLFLVLLGERPIFY